MTSPRIQPGQHAQPTARITSRERVFDGFHTLDIVRAEPRSMKFDGFAPEMEREIFSCGGYAMVVLYVPETDEIMLNEQFRLGAFIAEPENAFLLECAAGMLDEGETPIDAAKRETLEETGCEVLDLVSVGSFFTSPGCLDELAHVFIGRIAKSDAGGVFGVEEEGEEIRTHLLPAEKVFEMLDAGLIRNGAAALGLNWFARHRAHLRAQWLSMESK